MKEKCDFCEREIEMDIFLIKMGKNVSRVCSSRCAARLVEKNRWTSGYSIIRKEISLLVTDDQAFAAHRMR